MVYCGKPSRACHACRERKTRCDSKPGGCTQCAKAKRTCPGYRRQVDLIFRDQSENVIRKAKAREKKKAAAGTATSTPPSSEGEPSGSGDSGYDSDEQVTETVPMTNGQAMTIVQQTPTFLDCLTPTLEDRATCYFVKNYAIGITVPGYGEFNSLTAKHVSQIMDPTLSAAIKATSFASYATLTRNQQVSEASQLAYMDAIKLTNSALSSPTEVTKDTTLLSVILLSLYELLTGQSQRSMKDWDQHVRGAAALLHLRGPQQFDSILGRRMFVQAASSLLASCMQRNRRIPAHVLEMMEALAEAAKNAAFPWYMKRAVMSFQAMLDYNEFRCAYRDGLIPDPKEQVEIMLKIDSVFARFMMDPPPLWDYEEYFTDNYNPDIIFNGRYHIYRDGWSIPLCNNIRNFHLMINEDIRGVLLNGINSKPPIFTDPKDMAQFQRSTELCYQLQADILASVPQSLGHIHKKEARAESTVDSFPTNPWPSAETPIPASLIEDITLTITATNPRKAEFNWGDLVKDDAPPTHIISDSSGAPSYCGFSLLWPLWYCGFTRLANEDVKNYCVVNLRKLGNEMGVRQALILADTIVTDSEPKAWNDDS